MKNFLQAIILVLIISLNTYAQDPSTWNTIQKRILNNNCITCHYYGSQYADQSGLILTEGSAYAQLVDVQPKNTAANNDGLTRVSSWGGLPALDKSFLWEKINAPEQAHFYSEHTDYGSMMPLGLPSLTNGELQFIMRWIVEGAPQSGIVADENLLNDTTRFVPLDFKPLDIPVSGLQLHIGPFDVQPNQVNDREFMYYHPLNLSQDVFVNRVQVEMRSGSHHFILYTFDKNIPALPQADTYRDVRDSNGNYNLLVLLQMEYHRFFVGTQSPNLDYNFPKGVALRLTAGTGFDMNAHYVNRSNSVIQGEVYTNLYTVDQSEIQREAQVLFLNNEKFKLPPHDTTTIIKDFLISSKINLFEMWGHSHEHTLEFKVERIGASGKPELIYYSNDWQHPPMYRLDPPMEIKAGETLRLITTYYNWTDKEIDFGLLSSDEMQILYGMFYSGDPLTSVENEEKIPSQFLLKQNYPNPFNPTTNFEFRISNLPAGRQGFGLVTLKIYDVLGKEIAVLLNEEKQPGNYKIKFDASKLSSGIYFYRLTAGNFTDTKKMILLK